MTAGDAALTSILKKRLDPDGARTTAVATLLETDAPKKPGANEPLSLLLCTP